MHWHQWISYNISSEGLHLLKLPRYRDGCPVGQNPGSSHDPVPNRNISDIRTVDICRKGEVAGIGANIRRVKTAPELAVIIVDDTRKHFSGCFDRCRAGYVQVSRSRTACWNNKIRVCISACNIGPNSIFPCCERELVNGIERTKNTADGTIGKNHVVVAR